MMITLRAAPVKTRGLKRHTYPGLRKQAMKILHRYASKAIYKKIRKFHIFFKNTGLIFHFPYRCREFG